MKKILMSLLAAMICSVLATPVFASPAGEKSIPGIMLCQKEKPVMKWLSEEPLEIKTDMQTVSVGDVVKLTALSKRQGFKIFDYWNHAIKNSTVFDEQLGSYISEAVFEAKSPGIFKIQYTMVQRAVHGSRLLIGRGTINIEVKEVLAVAKKEVTGAEIRNLVVNPITRPDGTISGYAASVESYIVWSDQTNTLYGSIFFNFGLAELQKNINVDFTIEGQVYHYIVNVLRP